MKKNVDAASTMERVNGWLFWVAYAVWIGMNIFVDSAYQRQPWFDGVFSVGNWICLLILLGHLVTKKWSANRVLPIAVVSLIFLCSAYHSGLMRILITFLFVLAACDVDWKRLIRVSMFVACGCVIVILLSAAVGILPQNIILREDGSVRYYLGFSYTSLLANYFFHILLMFLYVKKEKLHLWGYGIIMMLNVAIYLLTDTRAVFALVFLALVGAFCLERVSIPGEKPWFRLTIGNVFVFCAVIALILIACYGSGHTLVMRLDKLLSGRLMYGHQAVKTFGLSLFGDAIPWYSQYDGKQPFMWVDCAYLNIAMNYGVVVLVLVCAGFTWLTRKAIRSMDGMLVLACVFLAIHSITDPQLYMPWYNPFLLLLGRLFYDGKSKEIEIWKVKDTVQTLTEEFVEGWSRLRSSRERRGE